MTGTDTSDALKLLFHLAQWQYLVSCRVDLEAIIDKVSAMQSS